MKRIALTLALVLLILFSIVAAILLFDLAEDEVEEGKLYTFPILVGEKTYTVSVRSNYSSAPEVSYFGLGKSVSIDFRGERENAFCNVTIPVDLIWGELSVIDKYYEMSDDDYSKVSNATHHFIHFMFNHTALVKHFEVRGTEGVSD